ncbi:ubiquinol-cytochrome c reductase iron-sulfur subunit [Desulfuromonas acetoxidans]|uniref:Rieske (2Fe-2S) region n=1 Tax=Desulfuromonas acetoxidans (strain DSM 684 / 11070) TaxID=281689 RepID=Q1JVM5_DESA6|nr:Rieske (2Fe-2S) protein [Desulfuromonas acetoxidans]EAT14296.1 Rieske (2Fe-2S) region [Desulfuromonas acetoxidans DSM 684]MBF0646219.1 Rieske (2Fe-2S) protein [Desulfuromonas acetoxidans]NVD25063.1 Rieske (2Fe-2S) protein [Desulfuromonas acetoxidans]NVE17108.1 Rieske (2Fe-2S) protein [Desulfuromonas acetoxidans]
MARFSQKRRGFIQTLIVGGISGWGLFRFFSASKSQETLLATVEDKRIPERGALVFRQQRFALIREQGHVYALSLVCTHLGCTLTVTSTELSCPCHGSTFDRHGEVTRGPADRPLPQLRLVRRADSWQVYG